MYKDFHIKKFADKLKDIVCILIGCTREQLEDAEFKNKELPEEWWYYNIPNPSFGGLVNYLDNNLSEEDKKICDARYLVKPTPRMLLQLLGTECGRNIIHPNVWVNALMSEYKMSYTQHPDIDYIESKQYPNWIITDMRFPNELEAVKRRGGITIRVNRPYTTVVGGNGIPATFNQNQFHPSETSLDNANFDYTIENNSTIEDLIHTVSLILKKEKII